MKYLRKFNTEADVMMFDSPNVVLVGDTKNVLYNVPTPEGVYIQHIDGSLYTAIEWTNKGFTNDEANGVAVIDDRTSFIIAANTLAKNVWSSNTNGPVEGVGTSVDDYKGMENTLAIAAIGTSGAANACLAFSFPNGQNGYLPALGEWKVAYDYKDSITEAMNLIGGNAILGSSSNDYHWSSTQSSNGSKVLLFNWYTGGSYSYNKTYQRYVRPFGVLSL